MNGWTRRTWVNSHGGSQSRCLADLGYYLGLQLGGWRSWGVTTPLGQLVGVVQIEWASSQFPWRIWFWFKSLYAWKGISRGQRVLGVENRAVTCLPFVWAFLFISLISDCFRKLQTASLCISAVTWPKYLSPRTRLTTSPGAVGQPGLESKKPDILSPGPPGWGHMSPCSPQVPLSPEGRWVSFWPFPEPSLSPGYYENCLRGWWMPRGAITPYLPAALGGPQRSGVEPCDRIAPPGLCLVYLGTSSGHWAAGQVP